MVREPVTENPIQSIISDLEFQPSICMLEADGQVVLCKLNFGYV